MAERHMLEPDRDPPSGWIVHRTLRDMLDALDAADPTEVIEISVRGTMEECDTVYEKAVRVATSAFHLLGGMTVLQAVHFHDPCHGRATGCHSHATRQTITDGIGVASDRSVPIGGQSTWNRDLRTVTLAGIQLPETVLVDIEGRPLGEIVASPMLDEDLVVHSTEFNGWSTIVHVRSPRDPRP